MEARNIRVTDSLHIPISKISSSMAIEKEIRSSDFICAIISSDRSPAVFFEIGLAKGIGKPIFLIIEDNWDIPLDLKNFVYVKAFSKDKEAITFSLDQFLNKYRKIPKSAYYENKEPKSGKKFNDYLSQNNLNLINNEKQLELFLMNLFDNLDGVRTVKRESYNDIGIDISLWIDKLESNLGNPVLVEIKEGTLSKNQLRKSEIQLRKYLENTNASTGLLIYLDNENRRFEPSGLQMPMVIWLELNNLVNSLHELSLADIIVKERNKMVHCQKGV
ncbi:hypothetical protein J2749_002350 [Methanobacterium oryzae]